MKPLAERILTTLSHVVSSNVDTLCHVFGPEARSVIEKLAADGKVVVEKGSVRLAL